MSCCDSIQTTQNISWTQITPLLNNAENVYLTKYKVENESLVKLSDFILSNIVWTFGDKGQILVSLTNLAQNDQGAHDVEKFNLANPAINFVFDKVKNEVYAQIILGEAVLRYIFNFKGSQKVSFNDLLKTNCSTSSVNTIIAL